MSATNIQLFSGAVSIPDDLRVVSLTVEDSLMELGANGGYANVGYVMNLNDPTGPNAAVYYDKTVDQLRVVHTDFGGPEDPNTITISNEDITLNVAGNTHSRFYYGDGGLLSNLVSDLQSVTAVEANSDQMIILSNATALWANVGNVLVEGNVTSVTGGFHGDGGWLTNVQTTFEETIVNGNTTSNIVEFHNALSLVTTGNVGIRNTEPLGDLSIGANVVFDDDATDILKIQGNVNVQRITIGEWVLGGGGSQGLQQITDTGNTTTITSEFNNTSTAFVTAAKAGIGIATPSSDAMLHVDGHVRLGGAADTPDNENMFVRAAGALNIIANHSNTDNTTSNLVMKAGEINAASITLAGAVTDDDRQKIVFKTREVEALTIDRFGNANFVSNVVVGTGAKFIGDGSGLTGLVSDLQSVSEGGASTDRTILFTNATEGANIASNLYVGSNLHLDDVTLAAASVTLQGVTTNGATTTDAITITDTTQASSTTTGALKVSGGIAAAKDIRAANVVVNRVGVGLTAGANPDPAHLVEVDGNVKCTNVVCESLTLDSVALQTLYSLDQVVNVNNTTSNIVVISNTTPSTSMSTGCLQLSGGLGVNGNVYAQEFVNTNAGGWRLTHTHATRPTVNGASVGGELTGGNGDVETGFLRLSGGGSTTGTGASKSYIDICGASASSDFANNITLGIKGSEKVRLTDVGLGIGTVSPLEKLDVYGVGRMSSAYPRLDFFCTTGRSTNDWGNSTGAAGDYRIYSNSDASDATKRSLNFDYGQNAVHTTRMCINAAGNVGIGTLSPAVKLDVVGGNIGFDYGRAIEVSPRLASGWPNGTTKLIEVNWGTGDEVRFFTPGSQSATQKMVINSYGNVGIGTTSPGIILDVGSSLSNPQIGRNYAVGSAHDADKRDAIYFGRWDGITRDFLGMKCRVDTHTNLGVGDYSNQSKIEFYTWGNNYAQSREVMCIRSDGNVGIGIPNPSLKMHVKTNNTSATEDGLLIENTYSSNNQKTVLRLGIGASNYAQIDARTKAGDKTYLTFRTQSTANTWGDRMTIDEVGNVGIGDTAPGSKLTFYENYATPANGTAYAPNQTTNGISWKSTEWTAAFDANAPNWYNSTAITTARIWFRPRSYSSVSSGQLGAHGALNIGTGYNANQSDTPNICLTTNDRVGINIETPSTPLHVNGTITCTSLSQTSDDRVKYNEQNVSNALTLINQLKPQKYEKIMKIPSSSEGVWIPTDDEWENVKNEFGYEHELGFIAQDVREIPELAFLVSGDETRTDTKTISVAEYSNLTIETQNTYTPTHIYVSNEEPISLDVYSNLLTDEQAQYYELPDATYQKSNVNILVYSNLTTEAQQLYTPEINGYTKQIETQTPLSLDYSGLFVVAIGAMQELYGELQAEKAKVATLETQLASVLARLDALENA